mmetsp:Transcript_15638/g.32610  ORF Transcript_15638/g.32610 Transcript_15638/m.32610 type:complete len:230 (-) Transcript_15638:139-828(-)
MFRSERGHPSRGRRSPHPAREFPIQNAVLHWKQLRLSLRPPYKADFSSLQSSGRKSTPPPSLTTAWPISEVGGIQSPPLGLDRRPEYRLARLERHLLLVGSAAWLGLDEARQRVAVLHVREDLLEDPGAVQHVAVVPAVEVHRLGLLLSGGQFAVKRGQALQPHQHPQPVEVGQTGILRDDHRGDGVARENQRAEQRQILHVLHLADGLDLVRRHVEILELFALAQAVE